MPANPGELIAALETLSSDNAHDAGPVAATIIAKLVSAREAGLLTIGLSGSGGSLVADGVTVHAGTLQTETVRRHVHQRAQWWGRHAPRATRPTLPQLFQADTDFASDAFRFAEEPLIAPKQSAVCVFEQTDPRSVSVLLAADMETVPGVVELAIFHSLASLVTGRPKPARQRRAEVSLSLRERECLLWSARGKTSSEIAQILELSEHTVNHYLANTLAKLHASNRTHAIVRAIALGALPLDDL